MGKYSAISSWSGYIQQGIISLAVAIDKILELEGKGENLADYTLGVELMINEAAGEDFDFRKGDKILEVHQVKVNKSSDGKASFNKGVEGLLKKENVDRFLHLYRFDAAWNLPAGIELYPYFGMEAKVFGGQAEAYLNSRIKQLCIKSEVEYRGALLCRIQSRFNRWVYAEHLGKGTEKDYQLEKSLSELKEAIISTQEAKEEILVQIQRTMWDEFEKFSGASESFQRASKEHQEVVAGIVTHLVSLPLDDFEVFIRHAKPNHTGNKFNLTDEWFESSAWKNIFLLFLTRVDKTPCEISKGVQPDYKKGEAFYRPTMIADTMDMALAAKQKIGKFFSSEYYADVARAKEIFEPDYLVTKELEGPLAELAGKQFEEDKLDKSGIGRDLKGHHPNKPKNVKLINQESAIKNLNE